MKEIGIHQKKAISRKKEDIVGLCPFDAIEGTPGHYAINQACRLCGLCVKNGPPGSFFWGEADDIDDVGIDLSLWRGIAVYLDQEEGHIHPVGPELIGKALELGAKVNQPVYALLAGKQVTPLAESVLSYGVDFIHVYDQNELEHFRIEPYAAVMQAFTEEVKPAVFLVGGTETGRILAPRVAARLGTGLTADCTVLDMGETGDLDQIRPAFGGNIMAHINTPRHRPQFVTVRYKIFNAPDKVEHPAGKLIRRRLAADKMVSAVKILKVEKRAHKPGIDEADILVVAGRGVKKQADLSLIRELCRVLGGEMAATRSLIENGWVDPRRQIGLSGRTVKPKLIITCGVSGAVQFVAGMKASDLIVAINTDSEAPIMRTAHYALHGDLYEIIPRLLESPLVRATPARSVL